MIITHLEECHGHMLCSGMKLEDGLDVLKLHDLRLSSERCLAI